MPLRAKEESYDIKQNIKNKLEDEFMVIDPKYSFEDIILNEKIKKEIETVSTFFENRKLIFDIWGFKKNSGLNQKIGLNFYGAPGTGKTMAAHALCNKLSRKILIVNYAQIESKYVGETSKNLEKLFKIAKEKDAIIFFDEADALLSKRVTNMGNSTDVSVNQTRSVLLLLLNEYDDLIIFATNFIQNIDSAFMRRIQAHIKFELPKIEERKKLWRINIPNRMPNNANVDKLSEFVGVSGSDIENAVFLAALRGANEQEKFVKQEYFEEAIKTIIDSKQENENMKITERIVSEEYAMKQIKGENK